MSTHHNQSFPNEIASYRAARDTLLAAEIELRAKAEDVAAMRRELPLGGRLKEDYRLIESPADPTAERPERETKFSDLFTPGKDTLVVYSFMLAPGDNACPACTSLIDGLDGMAPHIRDKVNFAVFAKAPIAEFRAWAKSRGWRNVRLLSTSANTYNSDYLAEDEQASQRPIINVFPKSADGIFHTWGSELLFAPLPKGMHPRHVDTVWPLWTVFDMTPEGRGADWFPKYSYD